MQSASDLRERPRWYIELPVLVAGYLAFGLIRAGIDRGDPAATNNSVLVQRLEQTLHLDVEFPLNNAIFAHPTAMYATGYFYRFCVLAVPVVLVWLYIRWPARYRYLRTVLVVATLLDLPLVWLFPESPPRFALSGVVDYIATLDIPGGAASRIPRPGVNLLAAMPSMHIAWTTWCAYAVWLVQRQHRPRAAWLAWLFPLITAYVVLATGQHYVLDVLAGIALLWVAVRITSWRVSRQAQPSAELR
jgi:membrane-associated phospholipid phosphatase